MVTGKVPLWYKQMIGQNVVCVSVCMEYSVEACGCGPFTHTQESGSMGWTGFRPYVLRIMSKQGSRESSVWGLKVCAGKTVYANVHEHVWIHKPLLLRCVRGGLESSTTPALPLPMTLGARRSSFWASVNASVSSFFHCTNSGSLYRQKYKNQLFM